jgi:hypothetical protein
MHSFAVVLCGLGVFLFITYAHRANRIYSIVGQLSKKEKISLGEIEILRVIIKVVLLISFGVFALSLLLIGVCVYLSARMELIEDIQEKQIQQMYEPAPAKITGSGMM